MNNTSGPLEVHLTLWRLGADRSSDPTPRLGPMGDQTPPPHLLCGGPEAGLGLQLPDLVAVLDLCSPGGPAELQLAPRTTIVQAII